jgi:hypothetical protein
MKLSHHAAIAACWTLAATMLPVASMGAQGLPAGAQFATFADRSDFIGGNPRIFSTASLDTVADGATKFTFPTPAFRFPFGTGSLIGASVQAGRIASATPFSIVFSSTGLYWFGADFRVSGGRDLVFVSFLQGGQVLKTFYGGVDDTSQFLGDKTGNASTIDEVVIGTANGSSFEVDNVIVGTPEPAAWVLLGSGLLALAAVSARKRKNMTIDR